MSVRRRRAAAPVSSSASTTIRPLTMCSPPAKRSIEATSALRQQVLVIWVEASSAFTCAVIAMGRILPRRSTTLGGNGRATRAGVIQASSTIFRNASASRSGSWRGSPGTPMSATTRRAPRSATAFSSRAWSSAIADASTSTAWTVRSGACSNRTARWSAGPKPVVSPACASRLSTTTSRPAVSARARRSPGTIRCGITELNHDPGPSTTHSAARIASTASAQACGSSGTRATDSMRPPVVATSTWPRTTVTASGSASSAPRTRAVMSIGVVAIGSTRPWAPRSRPTHSSAIRRSPGGRTPNSPRSLPDEPPLSATVTTAVRSSIVRSSWSRRSADRVANSPCPPPRATAAWAVSRATSLPAQVAVGGADVVAGLAEEPGDRLGHRDAAVLAARAADGDLHEPLALGEVALGDRLEDGEVLLQEPAGSGLGEHVVRHLGVATVLRAQLGDPVRVGQEAHVGHPVGVDGDAVLEAEADDRDLEARRRGRAEQLGDPVLQLVDVEVGGVEQHVGIATDVGHRAALALQTVEQASATLEGVRPAGSLLATHQHLLGRLEEEQRRGAAGHLLVAVGLQGVEERARPDVDHHRDGLVDPAAVVDEAHHVAHQRRREVVDDEVAEVLELLGRRAAAGAGHAGDDHELAGRGFHSSVLQDLAGGGVDRRLLGSSLAGRVGVGDGVLDGRGRARPDAGHEGDLVDVGLAQLLERPEVLEQGLAAHLAEPRDVVEGALHHRLGPQVAVVGDGEAVGLVADPLQEVEALAGAGHDDRVLLPRQPHLLQPLGQPADGYVVDAELGERLLGRGHLGRSAVDDDQRGRVGELAGTAGLGIDEHRTRVGRHGLAAGLLVEQPPEPSCDDLAHRRDVVLPVDAADDEAAVLGLAGQAVLEDDHGGDDLGALEVGHVVALDPQRHLVEAQRLLDLLEGAVACREVAGPLGLVEGESL